MRLRKDKRDQRQREALKRIEAWRALSPQEQFKSLEERRGNSKRQTTKILQSIAYGRHVV